VPRARRSRASRRISSAGSEAWVTGVAAVEVTTESSAFPNPVNSLGWGIRRRPKTPRRVIAGSSEPTRMCQRNLRTEGREARNAAVGGSFPGDGGCGGRRLRLDGGLGEGGSDSGPARRKLRRDAAVLPALGRRFHLLLRAQRRLRERLGRLDALRRRRGRAAGERALVPRGLRLERAPDPAGRQRVDQRLLRRDVSGHSLLCFGG